MNILFSGEQTFIDTVCAGAEIFCEEYAAFQGCLSLNLVYEKDNRIRIKKQGMNCTVSCREPSHFFKALNYIFHHMSEDFEKEEESLFPKNGFMLDCSRNAVFTLNTVKNIIRILAKLGMNQLLLYTEDTYEVPNLPYFGAYRGRYSKNELKELDDYAALFGVELVPCIQTLAHLRNVLRWPSMSELKDTDDILKVGSEKVYTFIEQLLISLKDCFRSRSIHIGMDEAAMLGLGNYLKENGYSKSSLLIKEHSDHVLSICRKLGFKPMMWSDMYITSNTGKGYYSPDENTDTSSWEKPDEDLALVYWDYYHFDDKTYENMLRVHREICERTVFAGGLWLWNGISPNYGKAFSCTASALRACRKFHIEEVFATAWMDNGAETPLEAVYPSLALFSYLSFHTETDAEEFKEYFYDCFDGRLEDFYVLDSFDSLFKGEGQNLTSDNPSKYLLYQDSMLGMFDYHIRKTDTQGYYAALAEKLELCRKTSPKYEYLFHYYQTLALVLAQKADLGLRIKAAYDRHDLSTLSNICRKVIPNLLKDLDDMHIYRERLWMQTAKPFGYEILDIKLGGVSTRLRHHMRRLETYLDGSVSSLEELEQERLPYWQLESSEKQACFSENYWHKIVSACNILDTL